MTDIDQKKIFSKNLNYFLSKYNKTQKEVADAISVSPQTFNTWCQGIALPRMGKVQKLADYFHIGKTDLIDERTLSTSDSSSQISCETESECNLVLSYRKLNDSNKQKCTAYTNTLLTTQQMEDELVLNAAHDAGATPEQKSHADAIMSDDSEWE